MMKEIDHRINRLEHVTRRKVVDIRDYKELKVMRQTKGMIELMRKIGVPIEYTER